MSRIVRITESDLRAAVADERYWRVGHPERGAFQNWVGQGFRGLNPSDGEARTTVWVRAYMRGGHWVSSHFRGTPARYGHVLQHLNTLEIAQPSQSRGPARFDQTDKFRYPSIPGSP